MPNPYPGNFLDQLELLDVQQGLDNYVALDLGAGGREIPGSRVLTMDLDAGHFLGDCLDLPIRDSCVDLILSQAVLEHVTNPDRAVCEMHRVLKPGGILYVEAAFMQPVHMEPWHYFNITPYGLAYLLRDWDVEWQSTIGDPDYVLDWVHRAYGPKFPRHRRTGRPVDEHYDRAASGVSALARKPV